MSRTGFRVNLHSIVCLNAKEVFARSRRHIWSIAGFEPTTTPLSSVNPQPLDWLSVRLQTKWLGVRIPLQNVQFSRITLSESYFLEIYWRRFLWIFQYQCMYGGIEVKHVVNPVLYYIKCIDLTHDSVTILDTLCFCYEKPAHD